MTEFASERLLLQEKILLHELNHRVNNEFDNAISMQSLAAAACSNDKAKGALSRVADLLQRFVDVHRAADAGIRHAGRRSGISWSTLPLDQSIAT
jgi:two-component sensor histidine kinase